MTAPSLLDELDGVVKFLLGERPLDGRWFGDDPPVTASGMKRHYWWRTDLRKAHADMAKRLETTERTLERCKQTLDTASECWRLDSERLEAAERDARVTKRSAETLCRIYFEIAAEAVGEDKVRAERDRRIHAAQAAPVDGMCYCQEGVMCPKCEAEE